MEIELLGVSHSENGLFDKFVDVAGVSKTVLAIDVFLE